MDGVLAIVILVLSGALVAVVGWREYLNYLLVLDRREDRESLREWMEDDDA